MSSVDQATSIDEGKLNAFVGQMLGDLGGASSIAMVRMGDALGLYKTLHTKGPMTSAELASTAKVDPRYLREWLSNQASSNYLSYDPASTKFALPPEQAGAIEARFLEDASYEDIARRLRCSEAVVRKRVSRGLATLRARHRGSGA